MLPLTVRGGELSAWISMLNPPVIKLAVMGKSKAPKAKDTWSLAALEKFSWSSPRFVGLPVDAARCILNVRINFCLPQRAEMGSEL